MTANRALIIVDVQPTFCEGGALAVEGGNAVAERIADFVTDNADEYSFIVTTQDWHVDPGEHFSDTPDFVDTWPPHGVAGTPEAELHEAVASLPFDDSVKKGEYAAAYSGFEGINRDGEPLERLLREQEISSVDVVGIAESHCVKETALDALKAGFPTRVLSDLTVPVSAELGEAARQEMDEAGVEQITSSEAFGFYDGDEDDVPLLADEWDTAGEDEWDEVDSWGDLDGNGIDDDLEDDEYGAADYEDDELAQPGDLGFLHEEETPEADEYGDLDGAELDGGVTDDALKDVLERGEDLSEYDLDDFDLDGLDLDEDVDFSDEVAEGDLDFDDLR